MMLDLPGEIVAEPVRQFELVERVVIERELAIRPPGPRQLQLVKNTKFHRLLPTAAKSATLRRRLGDSAAAGEPGVPPPAFRLCAGRRSTSSRTRLRLSASPSDRRPSS